MGATVIMSFFGLYIRSFSLLNVYLIFFFFNMLLLVFEIIEYLCRFMLNGIYHKINIVLLSRLFIS